MYRYVCMRAGGGGVIIQATALASFRSAAASEFQRNMSVCYVGFGIFKIGLNPLLGRRGTLNHFCDKTTINNI